MKITIYMKKENDVATPDVIEFTEKIVKPIDDKLVIDKTFEEIPVKNCIYLTINIDLITETESNNYDYYLRIINVDEGENRLIFGDHDGLLKITNKIITDFKVNNLFGFYKLRLERGVDFQTTGYENIEELTLKIFIKKTLKDRPERCKGIAETKESFLISDKQQ